MHLPTEISENQDIPIFRGFENQKLVLSQLDQDGYQVCDMAQYSSWLKITERTIV